MPSNPATITVSEPRLFNGRAVALVNGYGLLICPPILIAVVAVSFIPLGYLTALLPLLAFALTAYLLPFGFGNSYVTSLVERLGVPAGSGKQCFVVQLTLSPRIRKGLRALLEDADDIGYLTIADDQLIFQGDSVQLDLPFARIQRVQPRNAGLRVPFIHGWRIQLEVTGLPGVDSVEFAERSSLVLTRSWRIANQIKQSLATALKTTAGSR